MKILFFIDKMHPKQANSKKKLFFWVTTFLDEIFHDGKLTLLEQCTISDKVLTLKGLFVYSTYILESSNLNSWEMSYYS